MSLGLRLALMVLLAAAPIFLIEVIRELHLRDARRARVIEHVETLADQIAARENRFIEAARFLLTGISRLDEVTDRQTAQCSREMGQIAIHFPEINAIAVTDAAGQAFCGSNPGAAALALGDRPYFQAALRSKAMQTSGYILGRASHRGSVVFAYPVLDKGGRVDVVIVLAFSTDVLARELNNPPLGAGAFATLVDPRGKVVARWPDPKKWMGHDLSGVGWAKAALANQHSVVSTTVDGKSGAYAVASAPMEAPAQLTVLTGRPLGPV
ncbi:MAG: cache domain-containing protein, partial [Pseudolabrys sp.]